MFDGVDASSTWLLLAVFVTSFSACGIAIFSSRRFTRLAGRHGDLVAVQAAHRRLTPRVGGVAILISLIALLFTTSENDGIPGLWFVGAAGLLFLVGLLEDLGYQVSPLRRLIAVGLASLAVILLTGTMLERTGITFLDSILSIWIVAAGMTLLITMGLSNAFNLIDGVNGLAGLNAIVTALALALIGESAGHHAIVLPLLVLASGTLGYLVLNFPLGAIFLGDGGAYTLGFVLAWFGIEILTMVPEVSPWAILLTMFWPVADTCIAIYRRIRRSAPTMMPDRLHVHQLVMRGIEIICLGKEKRHISNPLTTIILAPFVIAPPIAGVLLWDNPRYALIATLVFAVVFSIAYIAAFPIVRRLARSAALAVAPAPGRAVRVEAFRTMEQTPAAGSLAVRRSRASKNSQPPRNDLHTRSMSNDS